MAGPILNNPQDFLSTPYGYSGEMSPDTAVAEQALNRRRFLANLLVQQGLQQPQGQMVGRFYVAPSPLQGFANLASVAAGALGSHYIDKNQNELMKADRQSVIDAINAYQDQVKKDREAAAIPSGAASGNPPAQPLLEMPPRPDGPYNGEVGAVPMPDAGVQSAQPGIPANQPSSIAGTDHLPGMAMNNVQPADMSQMQQVSPSIMPQAPEQTVPQSTGQSSQPQGPLPDRLSMLLTNQNPIVRRYGAYLAAQQQRQQEMDLAERRHAEDVGLRREEMGQRAEQTNALREMQHQQFLATYDNQSKQLDASIEANRQRIQDARTSQQERAALDKQNLALRQQQAQLDKLKLNEDVRHNKAMESMKGPDQTMQGKKDLAAYNAGLKEVSQDQKDVERANDLEASLKRWLELQDQVPTGRIVGQRPAIGQPLYQELIRLESQLAMSNFKPGQGTLSNLERGLMKGSGPQTTNDPETNKNSVRIMLGGVQNMKDRASYREWYLENNGKLLGADKDWNEYIEKNPRFIEDKNHNTIENPNRQDWQSYFLGGKQAAAPAASQAAPLSALPQGAKQIGTSSGKPVYETPDGKRFIGE